ncbi:MAG: hypothetical protein M1834_009304 [Cirrosporium novae-zelandiae]|nr:MAG: hypothetical protein M1834_009304 [Cirrosporium novae-zelandiae]
MEQLASLRPVLPTYIHLLLSAIFPIYAGAHASLSQPESAGDPDNNEIDDDDENTEEKSKKMEGLSPMDAILFPVVAGCTLTGLYFLIKWLQNVDLLNLILNYYFSAFGVVSVGRFFADAIDVCTSLVFPACYVDEGLVWRVDRKSQTFKAVTASNRSSPLPGVLGRVNLPPTVLNLLWNIRHFLRTQKFKFQTRRPFPRFKIIVKTSTIVGIVQAVGSVLYFNFVDNPWWLTNLQGFSFAYTALQFMSPTTFWTGTLILSGLFFYDIYFVFFTPLMVTVATKLEVPIKLLFPRAAAPGEDPKQSLAMLGLGDVVLPGMLIGLALRFDLYLFYLRKQKPGTPNTSTNKATVEQEKTDKNAKHPVIKVPFISPTRRWGERLWTNRSPMPLNLRMRAIRFSKVYFYAALIGYIIGMTITVGVMHFARHAQPALLYLVPGVLISVWGTAYVRGDIKYMWEYTEGSDDEAPKGSIFSPRRIEAMSKKLEAEGAKSAEDMGTKASGIDKGVKKGSEANTLSTLADSSGSEPHQRKIVGGE